MPDPALAEMALTHSSYAHEQHPEVPSNERLEFLGDAVLSVVVSALLYTRYPEWDEGRLTRTRAQLVCEASLAMAAETLGLPDELKLGRGEQLSGGARKPSLLADAFESVVGAAYLCGGLDASIPLVEWGLARQLATAPAVLQQADPKTRLAELLRQRKREPRFEVVAVTGPDHARRYVMSVWADDECLGEGSGRSKKEAEQQAAQQALGRL